MEINIYDYLDNAEIKSICIQEVRELIKKSFENEKDRERILGNLAYDMVFGEIEKITPDYKDFLVTKVNKILHEESSLRYLIYNNHYSTHEPVSFASKLVELTVKENQQIIKDKVVKTITEHDYKNEIANSLESYVNDLASNVYKLTEILTKQNENGIND
jgi:hypothetical protein